MNTHTIDGATDLSSEELGRLSSRVLGTEAVPAGSPVATKIGRRSRALRM
jgi:hypothetical protein